MNVSPLQSLDFTPWEKSDALLFRQKGYWSNESLFSILEKSTQTAITKERTAVIAGNRSWTYSDLNINAQRLALALEQMGLRAGMKVVVQLPNYGELFEILFALFRMGVAPILALPSHRHSEISYFCEFAQADAFICCDIHSGYDYRVMARRLVQMNAKLNVIVLGDAQEFISYRTLLECVPELKQKNNNIDIDATKIALFQLSGGTTGRPKLIPRTHNDYLYSIRASALICGLTHTSVYLAALPVVHNFPLSSPGALGVLWAGGTVVLAQNAEPEASFKLIEKHHVTITALVPPLALTWMNTIERRKIRGAHANLESLRVLQVGGAKFSEAAAQRVTPLLGCQLQQVFGMAEGLVNYTRLNDSRHTITTTQGRPISDRDEICIVDDQDQPLPRETIGHLLTRGPYTIRGYFRAPEHNAIAFTRDGFYRTGDLAKITEEGYLVVEGRAKDQINRGGEKISAEEIENHLLAHPDVQDAALVAMPDPFLGERSCAYVCPKKLQIPLKTSTLLKFLIQRELAIFKIPDRIELVSELPKTQFGKVDKKALRARISQKLGAYTHQETLES